MNLENEAIKKHIEDLANRSYAQNMFTFSGFLGMAEQSAFWEIQKKISFTDYTLFGGYEQAERIMIRFGSVRELGYEEPFPIKLIEVKPLIQKFADKLDHRDFLGALMNLGIEREIIGDICIIDNIGYVFCQENMVPFIMENIDKIRHTNVKCTVLDAIPDLQLSEPEYMEITVSSERVDVLVSAVYKLSRTESLELFRSKRIFINGRTIENNSYFLKENDVVTVRGFGKFCYKNALGKTKKGKVRVTLEKFGR